MPKTRITITVESDLVEKMDLLATERRQNRSQFIESLCVSAMQSDAFFSTRMQETWKVSAPTTAIMQSIAQLWLQSGTSEDLPIPTEIIVRQDAEKAKQWAKETEKGIRHEHKK